MVGVQASEDSQCYTFDMRKLSSALKVHKDHISAVYAPSGVAQPW